jgi:glucan-binding YG repeat protein
MRTGWQKIANSKGNVHKYYFFSNGVNAINRSVTIGSKTYTFNEYGICTNA